MWSTRPSAQRANAERHDAVLAPAGWVVVDEGELAGVEDVALDGGVGALGASGLAVRHDVVHDRVADLAHFLTGEVVGAAGSAAGAGSRQGRHVPDEEEADDGLRLGTVRLLHDGGDGGCEQRGLAHLLDEQGCRYLLAGVDDRHLTHHLPVFGLSPDETSMQQII